MPKDRGSEWKHIVNLDNDETAKKVAYSRMQCIYCDKVNCGEVNRLRMHLAGDGTSIA
jgi:hypothetical protein